MAVKRILLAGNLRLSGKSAPVQDFNSDRLKTLVEDLRDTLADVRKRHGLGRGIAAPQIGVASRVVYIMEEGEHIVMANPEILKSSGNEMKVWDSCFSYDLKFFVFVGRSETVDVRYSNPEGLGMERRFTGPLSELIQHEIDHLDGILSYQKALQPLEIMMREEWEKAGKPYIVR